MSFYRTLLATLAAVAIASPVFADDSTMQNTSGSNDSTMQSSSSEQSSTATESKVNVNKATAKDLMKVKGLNAAKARAIVAYRKKHGDFKSLDDLANVKGFKKMKPDMMKELQDQLSVD